MMGLNAPGLSSIRPVPGDPTTISDSFLGNVTGALFAGGFNPDTAQMTRGEWKLKNQAQAADSLVDFGSE